MCVCEPDRTRIMYIMSTSFLIKKYLSCKSSYDKSELGGQKTKYEWDKEKKAQDN